MRHRLKGRKLGRTRSHRVSTLRALSTALIKHKKITTTLAKAKETKRFVEPLITKAKDNSVHSKRLVYKQIKDREAVSELFTEIVEKVGNRPGGYTRIVKLGTRIGDAAEMAIIELVDFNELVEKKKKKSKPASQKSKKTEDKSDEKAEAPAEIEEAEVIEETEDKTEKEAEKSEKKKEKKTEEVKKEKKAPAKKTKAKAATKTKAAPKSKKKSEKKEDK